MYIFTCFLEGAGDAWLEGGVSITGSRDIAELRYSKTAALSRYPNASALTITIISMEPDEPGATEPMFHTLLPRLGNGVAPK